MSLDHRNALRADISTMNYKKRFFSLSQRATPGNFSESQACFVPGKPDVLIFFFFSFYLVQPATAHLCNRRSPSSTPARLYLLTGGRRSVEHPPTRPMCVYVCVCIQRYKDR